MTGLAAALAERVLSARRGEVRAALGVLSDHLLERGVLAKRLPPDRPRAVEALRLALGVAAPYPAGVVWLVDHPAWVRLDNDTNAPILWTKGGVTVLRIPPGERFVGRAVVDGLDELCPSVVVAPIYAAAGTELRLTARSGVDLRRLAALVDGLDARGAHDHAAVGDRVVGR